MNTLLLILALTLTFTSAQTWNTSSLVVARQGVAATSNGAYSFFAGGHAEDGASNVLDIYHSESGAWTSANITSSGSVAATSAGTFVFFAGGEFEGEPSQTIDIWNVNTQAWEDPANLTEARFGLAATSLDNWAFFAGGNNSQNASAVVDIWDGTTWSEASLSVARSGLAAVSAGEWVFFAGGWEDAETPSAVVDVWHSVSGNWSELTLTTARAELAVVAWENFVFFAGGEDGTGAALDSVEVYDIETQDWATFSPITLSTGRSSLAAAVAQGKVYFAGGRVAGTFLDSIDIWTNETQDFEVHDFTLSEARRDLAATVDADETIFFAGGIGAAGVSDVIDIGLAEVDPVETPTPTPGETPTPTVTPTPTPEETPTPTPTPTPIPAGECNTTCFQNYINTIADYEEDHPFNDRCGAYDDLLDCLGRCDNNDADLAEATETCQNTPYVSELCQCTEDQPFVTNARLLALIDFFHEQILAPLAPPVTIDRVWVYDNSTDPATAALQFSYESRQVNEIIEILRSRLTTFFAQDSSRFVFKLQKPTKRQTQTARVGIEVVDPAPTSSASSLAFSLGITMMIALFQVFF